MKVLVFSGHTGGHLFPAISFSETFKKRYPQSQITLVTTEKAKPFFQNQFQSLFSSVIFLKPFPSPSGFSFAWVAFFFRLLQGFWDSFNILNRVKPNIVLGFGSYASYPGIVLARLRRIPALIHEQNVVPGRATSWLVSYADKIATSFPETFRVSSHDAKVVCVGLPLRSQILETGRESSRLKTHDSSRLHLLVMGGSQGAHSLNHQVLDAFSQLTHEEKKRLVVNHIAGNKDCEWVCEKYKNLEIQAQTYSFFDRMDKIFMETNFAISRAGANTLFELSFFGIPALLIPYPYAGEHQLPNARFYEAKEAAWCVRESELNSKIILEKIRLLFEHPQKISQMSKKMQTLATPDAGNDLVDLAVKLMESSHD